MATYCNQHWLLSHIRNSFISTDETGICETVMTSDDLPKHFLKKFQNPSAGVGCNQQHRKSGNSNTISQRSLDPPLQEVDFVCYPGLDLSDDEDLDMTAQSFDIQMYPEIAHRFRSNTAQKLEKMDMARRKAARTRTVNVDDEIVEPERKDFFVKKQIGLREISEKENILQQNLIYDEEEDEDNNDDVDGNGDDDGVDNNTAESSPKNKENKEKKLKDVKSGHFASKLSTLIANSPQQTPNKFMDFARFDGTSQVGIQTKRINVYLSMLPEREKNYPIKICVIASAKISEVIGFICYKATMQFPDLPLKSVRHYALYMTEDNDDMDDFPPLDNKEPCSKFGFSQLTLAERRPLVTVTRLDYEYNQRKPFTTEEEKSRLQAEALRSLQSIELNGGIDEDNPNCISTSSTDDHLNDYDQSIQTQNDIFDAPMYRAYRVNFIDKRFFKVIVTLGICGERLEIDHKNSKFWQKQRQATYPIESVAYCEITEKRNTKATFRIWLKASSSSSVSVTACTGGGDKNSSSVSLQGNENSPASPGFYQNLSSPFNFLNTSNTSSNSHSHPTIRFKHYDFETDIQTAEHILTKLNYILENKNSEVRTEFLQRKLDKIQAKKHLKL